MNPAEWLQRTAHRVPDAPALLRGETVVADYAEFARRAAAIAGALRASHGIAPGDRILVKGSRSAAMERILPLLAAAEPGDPSNGN